MGGSPSGLPDILVAFNRDIYSSCIMFTALLLPLTGCGFRVGLHVPAADSDCGYLGCWSTSQCLGKDCVECIIMYKTSLVLAER